MIGADTSNDVMPAQYPAIGLPVHGVGMGAMGLWVFHNPEYEELAATCARLGRWEFRVVIAPLNAWREGKTLQALAWRGEGRRAEPFPQAM